MYKSIEEAQVARMDLVCRIQSIDNQLTERSALSTNPLHRGDYMSWKVRACRAKTALSKDLSKTKQWIVKQREKESKERVERLGGADKLLHELYGLVKQMVSEGVDINPDEQLLIDDVESYLRTR